jgi:hypothetical protein
MALLNGGASDALRALAESRSDAQAIALSRDIDLAIVNELWHRADMCLHRTPGDDDTVFSAAAEVASLLYAAA